MKIQCDVCEKEEATLFCSADEAALCDSCDRRVHRANKLASKHTRYSLLHPTFKDSPLCDICQEKRALLFCQEDRAILCRECDIPIHRSNEHTQKHSRFLLTGVRLSSSSSAPDHHHPPLPHPTSSSTAGGLWKQGSSSPPQHHHRGFEHPTFEVSPSSGCNTSKAGQDDENQMVVSDGGSMSTSSISEYLMETLPGWRVDEFLDYNNSTSSTPHGYCKTSDQTWPTPEYEFGSDTSTTSSVPEFFPQPHHHHYNLPLLHNRVLSQNQTSSFNGVRAPEKARSTKSSRRRIDGGLYEAQFSQGIHSFVL